MALVEVFVKRIFIKKEILVNHVVKYVKVVIKTMGNVKVASRKVIKMNTFWM